MAALAESVEPAAQEATVAQVVPVVVAEGEVVPVVRLA